MNRMRFGLAVLVWATASCGGASIDTPSHGTPTSDAPLPTAPVSKAWSVVVALPKQNILVGDTAQWRVTVMDSARAELPNEPVTWSTANAGVASVNTTGLLTGLGVGTTTVRVTVTNKPSIYYDGTIHVNAAPPAIPTRPAGALLRLGSDSVAQYGQQVRVSTLIYTDTSAVGADTKRGPIHLSTAPFVAPIARRDFPLLAVITDCPNGAAYGINYADSDNGSSLWKIDPATGLATNAGPVSVDPYILLGMTCDASNSLLVVGNFAGFGRLFMVNPQTGSRAVINSIEKAYVGVAAVPSGTIYVTTRDAYGTHYPANAERLATVNVSTGTLVQIGPTRSSGLVFELTSRGNRLLGISGSQLVQLNTLSGAIVAVRPVDLP